MLKEFKMIEAVAPDMLDVLQERFQILRNIYWMQPIGRRSLSETMGITERVLRTETDVLKQLNLIEPSKSGMTLTERGLEVYQGLELVMNQLLGMHQIEKEMTQYFGIQRCIVVAGDSDIQKKVLSDFGDVLTNTLNLLLPNGENTIAVMGGTTMAMVAENMGSLETEKRHNLFVPARGGIGEAVSVQANSISAVMSNKTGGNYRALYVPEQLSRETYNSLLQEPSIQEVLTLISHANCVVHSIGRALHMAARRKMSDDEMVMLKQKNAVAESFGYFFDEEGKVVYKIPRIGLQLKNLQEIPYVVAIAGGKTKAKAIRAYMKNAPKQTWLITDEAAANEILKGVTL
ncbi:sugar-binding domain-containing protein [Enterococcus faecalis]|uniref:sugar-binding transcriptional regulator n=1 Tax=Enterococcus faecalis TaxID=1351 RepID=UPI002E31F3A4|nr:sugar-binding domain-containing protein [Enterococcus faecalis]MED7680270.1 sugar-binding domain-containing protein [Enterococcus faecalis]MED7688156.1 sugar-binding domain-containing protein [Enterococcus faecalis]MED7690035.1 sugar-binding domain-containing protein [Enterococcus faecalis]MED7709641.1 sugar-binding domain-containing protein [Enterococcus faecalis]MED7721838.1 sugar-binding domain-containing protein [Enterococcus faecalis]